MITNTNGDKLKLSVVIPAFKVSAHIKDVINSVPKFIDHIVVVDDECPEQSGNIAAKIKNKKVQVIFNSKNMGVGGAMKIGYQKALKLHSDVIIKIDGDGQMDPAEIQNLIKPIINGSSDYSKGNRFYSLENVRLMPKTRMLGNLGLSFMSKISTGYYDIFDPNNGFTAINAKTLRNIPFSKIDNRYFFESDMLFQLNLLSCKVSDIPMSAIYKGEISSLKVSHSFFHFLKNHTRNLIKRILYTYFIRDFNVASLQLMSGLGLFIWGSTVGLFSWLHGQATGIPTQTGTLILVAILVVSGVQLLLSFINYDMGINRNRS
jgi:glycosyltransferase involved in cell wall biosynthesis